MADYLAAVGAWNELNPMVALNLWSPRLSPPPQPRVPSPQRRRADTQQRGAAGSARIASNTPFLTRPRSPRSHPGDRRPRPRPDRPVLLI
jgi:hypothetical protein